MFTLPAGRVLHLSADYASVTTVPKMAPIAPSTEDIAAVTAQVKLLPGYPALPPCAPAYRHIGALLTDAGLQAAVNYMTVVVPRVRRVLEQWPEAVTTDAFLARIDGEGLNDVLQWRDDVKPRRVHDLALLLRDRAVQTVDDLAAWTTQAGSRDVLLAVPGVGPKTVDYLANLAGQPSLAVDRHVRTFVTRAGVDASAYRDVHELLAAVAAQERLDLGSLDRAIWRAVSNQ